MLQSYLNKKLSSLRSNMSISKKFWSDYSTVYKEIFENRLINNKGSISLHDLWAAYMTQQYPDIKTIEEWQALDLKYAEFLSGYVLPLLKKGTLKVKVSDQVFRKPIISDKQGHHKPSEGDLGYFTDNEVVYSNPSQAETAVADIKERWEIQFNNFSNIIHKESNGSKSQISENFQMFYDYGVVFTLTENEWGM